MSDCPNVEMRELLPDYLSGTLSDARRRDIREHLATCQDCADELELLQLVRAAYAEMAPAVSVSSIVAALPKKDARPALRSWPRRQALQIAAAVSFIALGGMSLAVARSFFDGTSSVGPVDTVAMIESPAISFAGGVSDLGDEDLEALLSALETIEALPVTEPADPPLGGSGAGP